jgi:hypothetical protein
MKSKKKFDNLKSKLFVAKLLLLSILIMCLKGGLTSKPYATLNVTSSAGQTIYNNVDTVTSLRPY